MIPNLALSGGIGSGKTSLSESLSEALGWPRCSFGDYVRKVARDQGLDPDDRFALQSVGEQLVERGATEFCSNVISMISPPQQDGIIVDGVRHIQIFKALKELLAPVPLVLVYVETPTQVREKRLNVSRSELQKIEDHSTESDVVASLPQVADIKIDGTDSPIDAAKTVVDYLQSRFEMHS